MIVRILPRDEWDRLAGTELAGLVAMLTASDAPVYFFVAENAEGAIVGHFGLFPAWHAEAMWIDPRYRKQGAVMRGLLHQMQATARAEGVHGVVSASLDASVSDYLARLGAIPLMGTAFTWPLPKESVCLSQ